ncbi:type III-A CRISPR-associated protein Csm2 [Microcystis aeruginosa]|uniref:CRISPR system Cms protein Csm2 n=1 Tax=Microcystis aeruginosa PCC 9808 TaxID=1160284 RepID=I4I070_MICAE|nr:type III-A CRISPR-associated protein Csm2 [Microcystis aeruginosa]CCI27694.1 hypothetical protein MICAG_3600003 [Microcystis aeruginosa PCC 9808]
MNQKAVPPNRPSQPQIQPTELSSSTPKMAQETKDILKTIRSLTGGLRSYPIRELVKEAEDFGKYLKNQNVKTNQIRKFLSSHAKLITCPIELKPLRGNDRHV